MTGIILAGGQSKRMGQDKAFLTINGVTFIDHILKVFRSVFEQIIIISNTPEKYRYANEIVIEDILPEKGPMGGLYTGLYVAKYDRNFVAACDMPFISKQLVEYLIGIQNFDAVVPYVNGRYQPLFAVYAKKCAPLIKIQLDSGNLRISDLFHTIDMKVLNEDELLVFDRNLLSFYNANTPDDYNAIARMAGLGLS